jgi:hypothetical protein
VPGNSRPANKPNKHYRGSILKPYVRSYVYVTRYKVYISTEFQSTADLRSNLYAFFSAIAFLLMRFLPSVFIRFFCYSTKCELDNWKLVKMSERERINVPVLILQKCDTLWCVFAKLCALEAVTALK